MGAAPHVHTPARLLSEPGAAEARDPALASRGEVFRAAVAAIELLDVPWCVLHGYADYPDHITSDVDLLVQGSPREVIRKLVPRLGREIRLVQAIEHEPNAIYFVFATASPDGVVFLPLDVSADYRRNGRVFLRAGEVLDGRRRERDLWIPSAAAEFAYYVAKKVAKGEVTDAQAASLSDLFAAAPRECTDHLRRLFHPEEASMIADAAAARSWQRVQEQIPRLRRSLLFKNAARRVPQTTRYWLADVKRRARRATRPTGLFVAVLGPDGAGKSTVLARVSRDLAPAFRHTATYHLRPRLGALGSTQAATDPHAAPPRGVATSVAKLVYWLADYVTGYATRIWPKLVRSTLVLFDRYYFDLFVDARRYRYGGPEWLVGWFARYIPSPDLTVILDVPADVLRQRKRELAPDEARRQREEYLRLARSLPSSHVVDASRAVNAVVADVEAVILDHLARRAAERLGR